MRIVCCSGMVYVVVVSVLLIMVVSILLGVFLIWVNLSMVLNY